MASHKGPEQKCQVNATFTMIGSAKYSDAAKQAVLSPPAGKQRWMLVSFVDDDGQVVQFKVRPRLSKTGSITSRLTDKATCVLVTEDAAPDKVAVKAANKDAERKAIEAALLNLDK